MLKDIVWLAATQHALLDNITSLAPAMLTRIAPRALQIHSPRMAHCRAVCPAAIQPAQPATIMLRVPRLPMLIARAVHRAILRPMELCLLAWRAVSALCQHTQALLAILCTMQAAHVRFSSDWL